MYKLYDVWTHSWTLQRSDHHRTDDCSSEDLICAICQGEHQFGHASCPERKREDALIELQSRKKVGRSEAKRILLGDDPTLDDRQQKPEYTRYLSILFSETNRRNICPFKARHFF